MDIVVKLPDKNYSVILTKIMLACYGCEIIELPQGHGRLIDADAINLKDISPVDGFSVYGATAEDIDLTPTVLEAQSEVQDADSD